MIIRKAKEKDIPRILELLEQVLQIHADIRPDIFIPGTTKYTIDELRELLKHTLSHRKQCVVSSHGWLQGTSSTEGLV